MDWQPIETAPNDGTHIILLDALDGGSVYRASWVVEGDIEGYWAVWCGQPVVHEPDPTHWMPLPTPPSS